MRKTVQIELCSSRYLERRVVTCFFCSWTNLILTTKLSPRLSHKRRPNIVKIPDDNKIFKPVVYCCIRSRITGIGVIEALITLYLRIPFLLETPYLITYNLGAS